MPTETITVNSPKLGRSISIQNNIIHYVEHDGGRPVVLLHGLGFSLYSMRHVYSELVGLGYRVIAVDLPGCGTSF